jgi:hypothetical protein
MAQNGVRVIVHSAPAVLSTIAAGAAGWSVAQTVHPLILALVASLVTVEALYLCAMVAVRRAVVLDLYRLLKQAVPRRRDRPVPAAP